MLGSLQPCSRSLALAHRQLRPSEVHEPNGSQVIHAHVLLQQRPRRTVGIPVKPPRRH